MNKKLLIVFGVFDILTAIRSFTIKIGYAGFHTQTELQLLAIGRYVLLASLLASAWFLIRQQKMGIWLTYIQFPARVFFAVFSLEIILAISDFLGAGHDVYSVLMWILFVMEIIRLIITIVIHRRYYISGNASQL